MERYRGRAIIFQTFILFWGVCIYFYSLTGLTLNGGCSRAYRHNIYNHGVIFSEGTNPKLWLYAQEFVTFVYSRLRLSICVLSSMHHVWNYRVMFSMLVTITTQFLKCYVRMVLRHTPLPDLCNIRPSKPFHWRVTHYGRSTYSVRFQILVYFSNYEELEGQHDRKR